MTLHFFNIARTVVRPLLALLWLFALSACTPAPLRPEQPEKGNYAYMAEYLDGRIPTEMRRWRTHGLSIAVIDDQRVIWAKGYGVADAATGTAATPETIYRVGSISKLLTATEIMRRAERGELDLDDTLSNQLPDFSIHSRFAGAKPVTIRTLLTHHSGLPSNYLYGMWVSNPANLAMLPRALHNESLARPPQTEFRYSNVGYALLGRLIESKSNQPFAAAIGSGLLEPLGMNRSWFDRTAQPHGAYAPGYREGQPTLPVGLRDESAGSLLSSVTDLAKFVQFALADGAVGSGRLLKAETVRAMFAPQFIDLPLDFGKQTGLGWMLSGIDIDGAGPVAWHAGQYPGYYGAVFVSRDHKMGVIVLCNDERANKYMVDVGSTALRLALEAKLGRLLPPVVPSQQPPIAVAAEDLDRYAGDYSVFSNAVHISRNGSRLTAQLFGTELDLVPTARNRFALKKSLLGIFDIPLTSMSVEFLTVENRQFAVLRGLSQPFPFERIERSSIPDAWRRRLGSYRTDDSDGNLEFGNVELVLERGMLLANITLTSRVWGQTIHSRLALAPLSDDEALVIGADEEADTTVTARMQGGFAGFAYSGYFFHKQAPDGAAIQ